MYVNACEAALTAFDRVVSCQEMRDHFDEQVAREDADEDKENSRASN